MAKKKAKKARSSVANHVRNVLKEHGKNSEKNSYLTAYQILEKLPEPVRDRLIKKYGLGGEGSGLHNAATKVIARTAMTVTNEVVYLHTSKITFSVQRKKLKPGPVECGLFRISKPVPLASKRATKSVKKKVTKKQSTKKKST